MPRALKPAKNVREGMRGVMGVHKGGCQEERYSFSHAPASPMPCPLLSFFDKCPGFIETALYYENMSKLGGFLITQVHKDVKGHMTILLHTCCQQAGLINFHVDCGDNEHALALRRVWRKPRRGDGCCHLVDSPQFIVSLWPAECLETGEFDSQCLS